MLQLQLFRNFYSVGDALGEGSEHIEWILNNRPALETFLSSGDIKQGTWKSSLMMFAKILKIDGGAKSGWKMKFTVATSLVFTSCKRFKAFPSEIIDPMNFAAWGAAGAFFSSFLSAWHMRYIINTPRTREESLWARSNIFPEYKKTSKVGSSHRMVKYKTANEKGYNIHKEGALYYENNNRTLDILYKYGAVCGGKTQFGMGMSKAFGVPAVFIKQPAHASYMSFYNVGWAAHNSISGFSNSSVSVHQFPWNRNPAYLNAMAESQNRSEAFRLSEKLRWASSFCELEQKFAILMYSNDICPYNIAIWDDLKLALNSISTCNSSLVVKSSLITEVEKFRGDFLTQVRNSLSTH